MLRRLPVLAALAVMPLAAQNPGSLSELVTNASRGEPIAQQFQQVRVEGRAVYDSVAEIVKTVDWHARLPDAFRDADAAGKPVLWIQALGDLKGYT